MFCGVSFMADYRCLFLSLEVFFRFCYLSLGCIICFLFSVNSFWIGWCLLYVCGCFLFFDSVASQFKCVVALDVGYPISFEVFDGL